MKALLYITLSLLCLTFRAAPSTTPVGQCFAVTCGSAVNEKMPNTTCLDYSIPHDSYIARVCDKGHVCTDVTFTGMEATAACKKEPAPETLPKKLHGLRCEADDDCLSGYCKEKECKGRTRDIPCNGTADMSCEVGLSCIAVNGNYACRLQKTLDQKCDADNDCKNPFLCRNKRCTRYFSYEAGTSFPEPCVNGEDHVCDTLSCVQKTGESICTSAYKLDDWTKCTSDSDCKGTNREGDVRYTTCECTLNSTGGTYCTPMQSSQYAKSYIEAMKKVVYDDHKACPRVLHLNEECWRINYWDLEGELEPLYQMIQARTIYQHAPKTLSSDKCAAYVTDYEYYDAKYLEHFAGGNVLVTLFGLLLLLL